MDNNHIHDDLGRKVEITVKHLNDSTVAHVMVFRAISESEKYVV